jgi:hypothetical protein
MRIVGVSYYAAKEALNAGMLRENAAVSIVHEPTNTHDSNAHAAYCGSYKLGHVPRYAAKLFRASRVPSPIKGLITLTRGQATALEIRIQIGAGIDTAPRRHSLEASSSSASGIYAIVNVFNMRAYIGKAHNMENRRREHLAALQQGTHFSPQLAADWRTHPQRFAFVVVKQVASHRLDSEESKHIDLYGTNDSALGYNQGTGFSPGSRSDPSDTPASQRPVTPRRSTEGQGLQPRGRQGDTSLRPYAERESWESGPSAVARPSTVTNRSTPSRSRKPAAPRGGGCLLMLLVVPVFVCTTLLCVR